MQWEIKSPFCKGCGNSSSIFTSSKSENLARRIRRIVAEQAKEKRHSSRSSHVWLMLPSFDEGRRDLGFVEVVINRVVTSQIHQTPGSESGSRSQNA
ncbi:unnamed protein product [Protopolystoma xenopodis]|uniref:Uncharacterized protein n=1 Tax=Protopolystoma xenopodis TaxID=117903 RepID=A0A448WS16_9PLAT|nr:unnamed protein product [Protopolystoma xenopodis]